jgi:error-prone DNA polymerase
VISYRPKSAVRDVGKALGFRRIRSTGWRATSTGGTASQVPPERLREVGLDPFNPRGADADAPGA